MVGLVGKKGNTFLHKLEFSESWKNGDFIQMNTLKGKTALITGSGAGMGRSHALELARRGAFIVVHDLNLEGADETLELINNAGGNGVRFVSDIRDVEDFKSNVNRVGAVDILVNNAGVGGKGLMIEEIDTDIYNEMFEVHVRGSFFATQAVLPHMKKVKSGKIINISSIFAMGGHNCLSHYAGAKSAISGFTKSWAKELAPWKINVNAVAPGYIRTNMTKNSLTKDAAKKREELIPLGRFCEPFEISYAVAWLASHESEMMTGQVISPNGGEVIIGY